MTLDHAAEKAPYLRPKDAASILLMDRSTPRMRVLMGKRSSAHVFMPDVYVFPGGKRDREDSTLPFASDLHPVVLDKLMRASSRAVSQKRARALALAALRELHEETGLRFRSDEQGSTGPDLTCPACGSLHAPSHLPAGSGDMTHAFSAVLRMKWA